jgi:hypothetical protein
MNMLLVTPLSLFLGDPHQLLAEVFAVEQAEERFGGLPAIASFH